jgi:IS4 transposase
VTTLLDPELYPAEQLALLYARRWQIELWFRDLKTSMGMNVLRCQSPKMIHKELEMFLHCLQPHPLPDDPGQP